MSVDNLLINQQNQSEKLLISFWWCNVGNEKFVVILHPNYRGENYVNFYRK